MSLALMLYYFYIILYFEARIRNNKMTRINWHYLLWPHSDVDTTSQDDLPFRCDAV